MYEYYGDKSKSIISDTFCWNKSVKDIITIDNNTFEVLCDDNDIFYISISKEDIREIIDMNICNLPPEGCCFEHSGCGNNSCVKHYPLQEITFEFNYKELINNTIIGFKKIGDYQHSFNFILKDNKLVPLIINNNLPQYFVSL